jgi:hypothetical protein
MNLDRFIYYKNNAFTDEFCDSMVAMFDEREANDDVSIGQMASGLNTDVKNSTEVNLIGVVDNSFYEVINNHLSNYYLSTVPHQDKYNPDSRVLGNPTYYEVCQIQKYKKGSGHYNAWHVEVDGPESCIRPFSMIIYLNDVNNGGETSFLYTGSKVKPRKGGLLIFPSAFPFVHRGEVPISNDKYIIATWLAYKPVVNL